MTPVNIAHRGASAYAPEHTLPAYRLAIEMGADYVEQDLQLTKDGVLVCLHDATLERTTNVEDVFAERGLEIENDGERRRIWPVSDFTLDEVKRLDAGSWFDEEFAGVTVPTFQEAIDVVRGRAGIYPETKSPEAYRGRGFSMEEALVDLLSENGLASPEVRIDTPVLVQSFSAESLGRVRALAGTTYPLVQLVGVAQAPTMLTAEGLAEMTTYAHGVGLAIPLLLGDPSKGEDIRRAGLELHAFTVRASRVPEQFDDVTAYMSFLLGERGATGIFTDNPDQFPVSR